MILFHNKIYWDIPQNVVVDKSAIMWTNVIDIKAICIVLHQLEVISKRPRRIFIEENFLIVLFSDLNLFKPGFSIPKRFLHFCQ